MDHLLPKTMTNENKKTIKKGELLNTMIVLATNSHSGQFDRGGNPYILHALKVMHYLRTDDEELQCIAIGHDLIEDTDVTYVQLKELGFTDRIINGIKELTKQRGQSYDEYKKQVLSSGDAMKVKKCDLRHNSDIRRLKGVSEKDIARTFKYHQFYLEIEQHENQQ
jgi:(p)ppGpp synthase/HD superfamily hydrolase